MVTLLVFWPGQTLSLEFVPKVSVGANHHNVDISGSTQTTTPGGTVTTQVGGLLAQALGFG